MERGSIPARLVAWKNPAGCSRSGLWPLVAVALLIVLKSGLVESSRSIIGTADQDEEG
jgi:hypothetical protein